MRIAELRWTRYRIPFKRPLVTAHGVYPFREGAIVELLTDEGITGAGEIAPPPGFGVSLDEALAPLPELAALARSHGFVPGREGWDGLPAATRFGLDTAILDSGKRWRHQSWSPHWWRRVPLNATVTANNVDEAARAARVAANQGFRCIKLKVGTHETVDGEVARVAAVRTAIGPDVHLRLDANEAWDFKRALAVLAGVAHYNIRYCEQPVPRDDLDVMGRLRREQPIPIAADEAVTDVASVQRILNAQAADVLVLKPQCIGGEADCFDLVHLLPRGTSWVFTSSLEAGIGVVASARINAAFRRTLAGGLATLDLLEDDLIVEPLRIENGSMLVPYGLGLGVELDREALARYAI